MQRESRRKRAWYGLQDEALTGADGPVDDRERDLGVKWIIHYNSEFFHKIQNFRQISDLFSQIWLKKRHTSLFSGIWREIRKKIIKNSQKKIAKFEVFAIELVNIH